MIKLMLVYLLVTISAVNSYRIGSKADCAIKINGDLGEPQTLILRPDASAGEEWAYPDLGGDIISVTEGSDLLLECPGSSIYVNSIDTGLQNALATCVGGLAFSIAGSEATFPTITCGTQWEDYPAHIARYTGEICEDGNLEIEIGFETTLGFLRTMTVCFDPVAQNTIWSKFISTNRIGGYHSGFPRPYGFFPGDFYNVGGDINERYTIVNQRVTINQLLGLPDDSMKYIGSGDFYLSRGHLTAKADYVFGNQHNSTFWFINVAPQWQTFNGRNWNELEMNIRNFQDGRPNDIDVYTGTYGVTTLPHEVTGEDVPLYLYVNGDERGIPVPEIYWKVIYDPVLKAGTAFVGVNNPYTENIPSYCTNVCDQISWLTWDPADTVAGIGYCCDVNELRQTVTFIPAFEIESLLT